MDIRRMLPWQNNPWTPAGRIPAERCPRRSEQIGNLQELLRQYADTKSPGIREDIVVSCVGLVKHVVSRLPFVDLPGAEYSDLVGHGIIGLMYAVDRFDPDKGVKFETYAVNRIRGAVIDALRKQNWMPRELPRKMRMLEAATASLEGRLMRHPTDEELAAELGVSMDELDTLMQDVSRASMVSLDSTIRVERTDDNLPLAEVLSSQESMDPGEAMDEEEGKRLLVQALESLGERERLVLSLYYYEELTLKEIGAVLGVSESRVCQLHTRALVSLRVRLREFQYNGLPA